MNATTRLALAALVLATLAACGNKGPLFLPPPIEAPPAEATDDATPASDATEDAGLLPNAPIAPPVEEDEGDDATEGTQDGSGAEDAGDGAGDEDSDGGESGNDADG